MAHSYATARSGGRMPPYAPSQKRGTWKLAYADFLTALCAFFLVMWMINTPQSKRQGVAEYFSGDVRDTVYTQQSISLTRPITARLEESELLQAHAANVSIKEAESFVRLDLFDTSDDPLFANGSPRLNETGSALVGAAGRIISTENWDVSIEGHTDSNALPTEKYSNWDLSTERANNARRTLETSGVPSHSFRAVTGLADTQPLLPEASHLPANRRISIVIHPTK